MDTSTISGVHCTKGFGARRRWIRLKLGGNQQFCEAISLADLGRFTRPVTTKS
jgi:hypothetical protein